MALRRPSDPVFRHLPGDGVAMKAEHVGSIPHVALRALQRARDEHLFELAPGVLVVDTLVEHLRYQALDLIPHGAYTSSRPDRRRNASTYFSRVRWTTLSGSDGTGGCLFQRISSR